MVKSFKKNIVYNSIYRIVVILTPLVTAPYVARVLGAENIGTYNYCYAFAVYFVVFAMLGVNDYGNRSIAKARDEINCLSDTFWQIYYLQSLLAMLALIAYGISITLFKSDFHLVRSLLVAYVITAFFDIDWFAFGIEEFKITCIRNIIVRIAIVVGIFLFVKTEKDLPVYTAVLVFGNFVSTLPVWFLVFKRTIIVKPNAKKILNHLKPSLILFLPVIATTVYQQMDKIMLGSASMISEVGYYQNAENIVTLPTFLTSAIVTVMLPHITNLRARGKTEESIELMESSLYYSSILNIAMMFGLIAIADVFIPWYLGKGFERSASLVMVIAPIILIGGVTSVVRYEYLIPKEMDKVFTISIVFGAFVNVVLNALLIPSYQANGAAIATVVAYSIVLVYQFIFSHKEIKYFSLVLKALPYFLLGLMMCFFIRYLNSTLYSSQFVLVVLDLICGVFIYGTGSALIMFLTKDKLLSKLFRRRL